MKNNLQKTLSESVQSKVSKTTDYILIKKCKRKNRFKKKKLSHRDFCRYFLYPFLLIHLYFQHFYCCIIVAGFVGLINMPHFFSLRFCSF